MVLTVIGSDRPGLVQTLADVVLEYGGSWERSQLAQLAGLFAGIVVVEVGDGGAGPLRQALSSLEGVLHVQIHDGVPYPALETSGRMIAVDLLGNDRPGIVRELSTVFARHQVSIDDLATESREAPMAGGRLFEARLRAAIPDGIDIDALQRDLEALATELMVDVTVAATEPD